MYKQLSNGRMYAKFGRDEYQYRVVKIDNKFTIQCRGKQFASMFNSWSDRWHWLEVIYEFSSKEKEYGFAGTGYSDSNLFEHESFNTAREAKDVLIKHLEDEVKSYQNMEKLCRKPKYEEINIKSI